MSFTRIGAEQGEARTNQAYLQRLALSGFCFVLAGILFLIDAAGEGGITTSVAIAFAMALVGTTMQFVAFRKLCSKRSG
jgi:hypothetical protein